MKFETETGSAYQIKDGLVRRIPADGNEKRADGEWVRLVGEPDIRVGYSARMVIETLAAYGSDDEGNVASESPVTYRTTSRVVSITHEES